MDEVIAYIEELFEQIDAQEAGCEGCNAPSHFGWCRGCCIYIELCDLNAKVKAALEKMEELERLRRRA